MSDIDWIVFSPEVLKQQPLREALLGYAKQLNDISMLNREDRIQLSDRLKGDTISNLDVSDSDRPLMMAAVSILADLFTHGWEINTSGDDIRLGRPQQTRNDPQKEKERIRDQLHIARQHQLRSPATRSFIRSMEKRRLYGGAFVSVFSLMRDGADLSKALRDFVEQRPEPESAKGLSQVIKPYLQFVEAGGTCSLTGFPLLDIWRYFRHTWANPYSSVPGRWMPVLIRDAAAQYHPIIGIAALTSPVVQLRERDKWIGWSPELFTARIQANPSTRLARWLKRAVDESINDVYKRDFIEDGLLTFGKLRKPLPEFIESLEKIARAEREKHHRFTQATEYKSVSMNGNGKVDWSLQARSPLYRSKRAELLARFLKYRMILNQYFGDNPTGRKLEVLLKKGGGRELIQGILKKLKADRIGISVADIAVCGSLPPYNELLGGKLVAMLLTSPEIVEAYKKRYQKSASIIASSMAGRAVIREPILVLLCTTSLFGIASSQYNRIKIPCDVVGGIPAQVVKYIRIGNSMGFGTHQFSPSTVDMLAQVASQSANGLRVNNVFGEGVNPKLRLIRQGLDELGLESEEFLVHGSARIVYGIPLATNFTDFLLGLDKKPHYYFPQKTPKMTTERIVRWWYQRWLSQRILNTDVLKRVEGHNLIHPIKHGARAPRAEDPEQPLLFADGYNGTGGG